MITLKYFQQSNFIILYIFGNKSWVLISNILNLFLFIHILTFLFICFSESQAL